MKILNYGSLNTDHVYHVSHIVLPGETIPGSDLKIHAGGKGANQSVALAKAGASVWHAGKIGTDGGWLKENLEKNGVNTDFVHMYDGPTGHTIIQVTPEGQNSIILFNGGNARNTIQEVEDTLSCFDKGDYLIVQNEINLVPRIIEIAIEKGLKVCLNPAPLTDEVRVWNLDRLEYLVVNELEGQSLSGIEGTHTEILDKLVAMYPEVRILMTLGKDGALYGLDDERLFVPAFDAHVVDTTGAGDTYFGYFLQSVITGTSIRTAMVRASIASAITVSRRGAMDSIPDMKEVNEAFMRQKSSYVN